MEILDSMKGYLNKTFSKKDLSEAAYIITGTRRCYTNGFKPLSATAFGTIAK